MYDKNKNKTWTYSLSSFWDILTANSCLIFPANEYNSPLIFISLDILFNLFGLAQLNSALRCSNIVFKFQKGLAI